MASLSDINANTLPVSSMPHSNATSGNEHLAKAVPSAKESEEPSPDEIKKAIKTLNEYLANTKQDFKYQFINELNRYSVSVVNSKGEVIQEIPPKQIINIAIEASKKLAGMLIDRQH